MKPRRPSDGTTAVRVIAPARLHLGFLDLNGDLGRKYGSIGLSIETPHTDLRIAHARMNEAIGPESRRVLALINKFARDGRAYRAEIATAIPAHAGLGSGTQLALAVGAGIARLNGETLDARALASLGERGARSGIGVSAFASGGFIIDGGKGKGDAPPPVTLRADFPEAWRVLLICDHKDAGVSGEAETTAFAGLPEFPAAASARICRLVLMELMPGLVERDLESFGRALTEIQELVGGHFAAKQGGSAWTSEAVGRLARKLRDKGACGIGQSSWGPTGFAFVDSQEAAERLYHSLVEEAKGDGLDLQIARGRNAGAMLQPV